MVQAHNPSAMTLDGTRTHIVGRRHVAIIDPGPDSESHIDAIVDAVRGPDSSVALRLDGSEEPLRLSGHFDAVTGVAFCPDGTRVATSSLDGTVRIWRVTLPELLDYVSRV